MQASHSWRLHTAVALVCAIAASTLGSSAWAQSFKQTNLVSDVAGAAAIQDPHLVNAWGMSYGPGRPFWVSDNGTGLTTLYGADGSITPLVVTLPGAGGGTSKPTGQLFTGSSGVVLPGGGSAAFTFASEDGTLSAWNPTLGTNGVVTVDNSSKGSIYKGLAQASTATGTRLYAADFHNGAVDVFNDHFQSVSLGAGAFTDPTLPSGYAPFNIANLGSKLLVTYALQDADKEDDARGAGHGFVDVFNVDGSLDKRLVTGGTLNSPWGVATAPSSFGSLSGSLLIGNFGDGKINAFDPSTGAYRGTLKDIHGQPLVIDGLWGLASRSDLSGTDGKVFFTAGPGDEAHGLLGSIAPVPEPSVPLLMLVGMAGLLCRRASRQRSTS